MSELVLVTYRRIDTAEHVLAVLQAGQVELPGPLDSAACVRMAPDGAYTVSRSDPGATGQAVWGVFWDALFGLALSVPAAGTAYGRHLGGLFGAIDRAGVDAPFRIRLRHALGAGSSGLGVLASGWDPEPVLRDFLIPPRALLHATVAMESTSELMAHLRPRLA